MPRMFLTDQFTVPDKWIERAMMSWQRKAWDDMQVGVDEAKTFPGGAGSGDKWVKVVLKVKDDGGGDGS